MIIIAVLDATSVFLAYYVAQAVLDITQVPNHSLANTCKWYLKVCIDKYTTEATQFNTVAIVGTHLCRLEVKR